MSLSVVNEVGNGRRDKGGKLGMTHASRAAEDMQSFAFDHMIRAENLNSGLSHTYSSSRDCMSTPIHLIARGSDL
jgi:hypothetical protein